MAIWFINSKESMEWLLSMSLEGEGNVNET